MKALRRTRLTDAAGAEAELVRQSHHDAIAELQGLPAMATQIINDVELPDAVVVLIKHKLGRRPRITLISPARGVVSAGIIAERRDANPDPSKFIALQAGSMGATVFVDVEVK